MEFCSPPTPFSELLFRWATVLKEKLQRCYPQTQRWNKKLSILVPPNEQWSSEEREEGEEKELTTLRVNFSREVLRPCSFSGLPGKKVGRKKYRKKTLQLKCSFFRTAAKYKEAARGKSYKKKKKKQRKKQKSMFAIANIRNQNPLQNERHHYFYSWRMSPFLPWVFWTDQTASVHCCVSQLLVLISCSLSFPSVAVWAGTSDSG